LAEAVQIVAISRELFRSHPLVHPVRLEEAVEFDPGIVAPHDRVLAPVQKADLIKTSTHRSRPAPSLRREPHRNTLISRPRQPGSDCTRCGWTVPPGLAISRLLWHSVRDSPLSNRATALRCFGCAVSA